MNKFAANALRFVICGISCGLILWYSYRDMQTSLDRDLVTSYLVTCILLAAFGLIGWILRSRKSRWGGFISSALIAAGISLVFIQLTGSYGLFGYSPWTYFYKDDYIYAFRLIAPTSLAILTGLLSLIPEQPRASASSKSLG